MREELKKGDRVRVSCTVPIALDTYTRMKPSVSVEVEIGDDPTSDSDRALSAARCLVVKALANELELMEGCLEVLEEEGVEGLVEYCAKEQNRYGLKVAKKEKVKSGQETKGKARSANGD